MNENELNKKTIVFAGETVFAGGCLRPASEHKELELKELPPNLTHISGDLDLSDRSIVKGSIFR